MSFILDALKKSENERQRTSGPALFEVKTSAPRPHFPRWALLVGALLAINLSVLLWLLLHRDAETAAQAPPAQTLPAPAAATSPGSAAAVPGMPATPSSPAAAIAGVSADASPPAAPLTAPASLPDTARSDSTAADVADNELPTVPANPADERPAVPAGTAEAAAAQREHARAQRAMEDEAARVREQLQATAAAAQRQSVTAASSGLPTREELVNSGRARIPELTMSLHAFDSNPARRFIFINGQRAHEGDAVGGGVVLEAITRDGAILSLGGQRFMLPVQ